MDIGFAITAISAQLLQALFLQNPRKKQMKPSILRHKYLPHLSIEQLIAIILFTLCAETTIHTHSAEVPILRDKENQCLHKICLKKVSQNTLKYVGR